MAMRSEFETVSLAPVAGATATSFWSQFDVDPAEAWDVLLGGEWMVVDHVAGPSSRTILARSASTHASHEALDAAEIRVARRRAHGDSIKVIACELGLPGAAVCSCVASVMRKLKLRSPADLVALLHEPSPWGLIASQIRVDAEDFLVLTYPAPYWPLPPSLTSAEQGLVLELVAGGSNQAIAQARNTSPRTVANQVASIFRKLGVHSRLELFVALRPSAHLGLPLLRRMEAGR
jgi:DNA-binding NarL/FixJ family response regulator